MQIENLLLDFYQKNSISPVHQNILDFNTHIKRRGKLYRSLGMPEMVFNGTEVLEIGPGGGYNSLAFLNWGATMTLVEPNKTAVDELYFNFKNQNIDSDKYQILNSPIEDCALSKKFNIVIAEGFIPGMNQNKQKEVITKVDNLVNNNGIVVVTCFDEISIFFDLLKRLVGSKLTFLKGISDLESKKEILIKSFEAHFSNLSGASRPVEDWVLDNLINPAMLSDLFSIADCIEQFGDNYDVLGSSPRMFSDYTWYKDLNNKYGNTCKEQFAKKRHMLIDMSVEENERPYVMNYQLIELAKEFKNYLKEYENSLEGKHLVEISKILTGISGNVSEMPNVVSAINEVIQLINDNALNESKISESKVFSKMFGRGMQYVSMIKNN
ncbi:MAG: methyltransferase domain-containing protein [Syntrophomonadaceae bacterium]|nr:methyltransferase domain-containing protein [Syntrophomonadaceae bacterium]